jgi:hypothetical protein
MSTRAKGGTDFAGIEGRDDDAIQQAGIAGVFAQLRDIAPQFLRLQQGLIGGLAESQAREAKRLAAEDKDDPLVEAAEARAERAGAIASELARAGEAAQRVAEGVSNGGMFHGYVFDAQGEPATGYVVQVSGASEATSGRKAIKAKTDETGYFRIEFDTPSRKSRKAGDEVEKGDGKAEAKANDEAEKSYQVDGQEGTERIEVDITSPAKKVVFRDPNPPAFDDPAAAVFRFYPLIDFKSAARAGRFTGSPTAGR